MRLTDSELTVPATRRGAVGLVRQTTLQYIIWRSVAGASGLLIGVTVASLAASANVQAIVASAITGALLVSASRLSAKGDIGTVLWRLTILGFALRTATAVSIFDWSTTVGREGFLTGDDWAYARLAWAYTGFMQGEPHPPLIPPYCVAGQGMRTSSTHGCTSKLAYSSFRATTCLSG